MESHRLGCDGQQQRGLGPAGVSVPTLRHGAPDEHLVTLGRGAALHHHEPLLVAAVGVDEHHARKGVAGGTHELDEQVGQDPMADEQRAGEVGVLAARTVGHGGRHGDALTARRQPRGNGASDAGVGVERQVGPVLLE